ncbi:unnamed protein product [Prorocentrum cordatum]|uniref:Uncharacterized protein n=1 Tax=Prorocentrum cordatum TaxID=2364126 RepID=A0ABN9PGX9_9DINO|nr:unnamed protein product [Polarella glacialis]
MGAASQTACCCRPEDAARHPSADVAAATLAEAQVNSAWPSVLRDASEVGASTPSTADSDGASQRSPQRGLAVDIARAARGALAARQPRTSGPEAVATEATRPIDTSSVRKKASSALLKGLRNGSLSRIIDESEAAEAAEAAAAGRAAEPAAEPGARRG